MPKSQTIPYEKIAEPKTPARFQMDEEKLNELVESMAARGLLQPIGVFPVGNMFEITFGHRRWRAAGILGWKEMECLVFDSDAKARYADMMDENLCREDITAAEEATKYMEVIEELDCTEAELLAIFHKPANYVYARLDLLKGDKGVFEAVALRQIVLSVAQQLNRVDHEQHRAYLLRQAVDGGASARVVAGWVVDYKRNGPGQTVSLAPLVEQGQASVAPAPGPVCAFCGKGGYPGNQKWIMVHDFELDGILAQIAATAQLPPEAEVPNAG